jgi:hypothetical protein
MGVPFGVGVVGRLGYGDGEVELEGYELGGVDVGLEERNNKSNNNNRTINQ